MRAITGRYDLRFVGVRNRTDVDDRTLRRLAFRGVMTRVRPGVFVSTEVWRRLTPDARQRLLVVATLEMAKRPLIASHRSAAALWNLPTVRPHAPQVDVLTAAREETRSERWLRTHAVRDPSMHVVERDGLLLTSIERTVVDLALTQPFDDAVVATDYAVKNGLSKESLRHVLDELRPARGRARAERVIDFADGRSGSPGESKSRVCIFEFGFPAPDLQVGFTDSRGFIGAVDFFWSEYDLIGEFDGLVKYVDPAMLRGRTPQQALVDEKRREDRLRARGPRVIRWINDDLYPPSGLAGLLTAAGLPRPYRSAA